jgi:hypothetical protein
MAQNKRRKHLLENLHPKKSSKCKATITISDDARVICEVSHTGDEELSHKDVVAWKFKRFVKQRV